MMLYKIVQGTVALDLPHGISLMGTVTRGDTKHHFQGLTFTSLVSFQLPLDYGIVYTIQLLTWIPQKHFENLLLIF